jgi:protocatechuate 3,4-dioxygenase beta subunit
LPALVAVGIAALSFAARSLLVDPPAPARTVEPAPHGASDGGDQRRPSDDAPRASSPSAARAVSGRVQDAAGVGLAGARVCVAPRAAACCEALSCTFSDGTGHFVLEPNAERAMVFASLPGYRPLSKKLHAPLDAGPLLLTLRAGGVRITGVVADASGGPIAGAWLSALGTQDEVLALGASDGAGNFGLDVTSGVLRVSARADGYSEQLQKVRAPSVGVRFALTPASSIVGRTLSAAGLPVGDVQVIALGQDGVRAAPPAAHSEEDGTFRLQGLAAGRYALLAVTERWRSDPRSVHVAVAQTAEPVDLVLRPATTLTAVVNVAGVPCERGSVSAVGAVESHTALQAGRVVFDSLIPGRYRISIECEAGLSQSDALDLGTEPVTRVWELEQGQRVTGVALTSAGTPLVGAKIEVSPVAEPFGRAGARCTSGERGEFSCAGLLPGAYDCAIGQGVPLRSDSVRVAVTEAAAPHVILRAYPEGALRVRIENAAQFELQALPLVARGKTEAVLGELEADAFVFEPLALGRYEIASESAAPGSGQVVELTRAGEVVELTLQLPSAHTISGRVVDDDGQGVPDAWVRAALASLDARVRPVTPVLTDGQGAFSLPGLVPGRYRLMASSGQGEALLDDVASDGRGVLLRLPSYGSLTVSLLSAAGSPVGDFVVAYRRSEEQGHNEAPGSQGAWTASWLAPGRYQLTAKAEEGSVTEMVELPPGGEVSVALRLESQRSLLRQEQSLAPVQSAPVASHRE